MKFGTRHLFLIFAGVFVLSFVAFLVHPLNSLFFIFCLLLFAFLTFQRLEYGVYILLGDVFVTSFGYLFQWEGMSLRIGMAVVFVAIALYRILNSVIVRSRTTKQSLGNAHYNGIARLPARQASADLAMTERGEIDFERLIKFIRQYRSLSIIYVVLVIWILWSFAYGVVWNGFSNAFQDFNGFLFLIFLPIIPALNIEKEKVFTILKAGLLWMFVFVSLIEVTFAWFGENEILYKFVRDVRLGEITPFVGNFWRIFTQSEVYAVMGLILALTSIFYLSRNEKERRSPENFQFPISNFHSNFSITQLPNYLLLFTCFVILLLSLSRSFWLGAGASLVIFAVFTVRNLALRELLKGVLRTLVVSVISVAFVLLISNTWLGASKVVESRLDTAEPAASSRSAQLGPLNDALLGSPVVGYGFGKEVRYCSNDPRRVKFHGRERPLFPDACALTKTWAFELGWHDMTLKTGLVGTLLYLSFIILLMKSLFQRIKNQESRIKNTPPNPPLLRGGQRGGGFHVSRFTFHVSSFLSLLSLIVIHAFTPYLNHPLGIGFLMIAVIDVASNRRIDHSENNVVSL